jgi:class 3 adenylate cyclase/tetratricopeptide (TPR) repeat protein
MPDNTNPEAWPLPELHRARRAIVVVDVVESVRLMQEDEAGFIGCWRRFVNEIATQVLPKHGGRLVKSLGDGLLLEFETVPPAVAAALDIQARVPSYNAGRAMAAAMYLRIGAHVADVVVDELDVYGAGVNLAARLASLAGPGEVVVSCAVHDEVVEPLDGELTDMGDCYVKHLSAPIRAWRVASVGASAVKQTSDASSWKSAIAVVPLIEGGEQSFNARATQVFADDLTRELCTDPNLRVVSNLSTWSMVGRRASPPVLGGVLNVRYVLRAQCTELGANVVLSAQLLHASDEEVVWAASLREKRTAFENGDSAAPAQLAHEAATALSLRLAAQALGRPLPSVDSCSLLNGSVLAIHRTVATQSELAGAVLQHLIERHPRAAEPHAWSAKRHMLRIAQRWSAAPLQDAQQARAHLNRALDLQPGHALALAIDGHTSAFEDGQLDRAETQLRAALAANASEPLAWLFLSNLLANRDCTDEALAAAERANALAPLDPTAFLFDIFTAYAALAAGRYTDARRLAERSVRGNAVHLPSLPVLAIAQVLDDDHEAATQSAGIDRPLPRPASRNDEDERAVCNGTARSRAAAIAVGYRRTLTKQTHHGEQT